jgi:hypothetical protein
MASGQKHPLESICRSITDGVLVSISYWEILSTSKLMDAIFEQINDKYRIFLKELYDKQDKMIIAHN